MGLRKLANANSPIKFLLFGMQQGCQENCLEMSA